MVPGKSTIPVVLIVNPAGGRGRARRLAERTRLELGKVSVACEPHFTTGPGDAERLAREAVRADAQVIAACGGDGTLQEVANALAGSTARLAILPGGRCNDFARALHVPHDPTSIARRIAGGTSRKISLGRINGRYFCTVAALGFDAAVSSFVHTMRMPLRGTLAYVYGVLRVLPEFRPPLVEMRGDFGSLNTPVFLTAIGNTAHYGGGIQIVPPADVADDQLDLCVVPGVSFWRVLWLLPQAIRGRHTRASEVRMLRTRTLEIASPEKLEIWADGELIARTPAHVEAVPDALHVVM